MAVMRFTAEGMYRPRAIWHQRPLIAYLPSCLVCPTCDHVDRSHLQPHLQIYASSEYNPQGGVWTLWI
eukprot:3790840-Pleurochrysis_carterae.AAC.1